MEDITEKRKDSFEIYIPWYTLFFKKKLSTYMLLYKVKTKIHNLPRSQLKSYLDFNFGTPTVIFIAEANAIKRVL